MANRKAMLTKAVSDSNRTVSEASQGVVKRDTMSFARSVGVAPSHKVMHNAEMDGRTLIRIHSILKQLKNPQA